MSRCLSGNLAKKKDAFSYKKYPTYVEHCVYIIYTYDRIGRRTRSDSKERLYPILGY